MRAFVFSLDAFVAFILALVAVYSLIFFSSVPSAYYFLLTQAHYLSRDALMAVSTTDCAAMGSGLCSGTVLDMIISEQVPDARADLVRRSIGNIIPTQFGYTLELSQDNGASWDTAYDTQTAANDKHANKVKKLKISTQVVNFGLMGTSTLQRESPYAYASCHGSQGGNPLLITCGDYNLLDPNAGGDALPKPEARLVKLTVFI